MLTHLNWHIGSLERKTGWIGSSLCSPSGRIVMVQGMSRGFARFFCTDDLAKVTCPTCKKRAAKVAK